MKFRYSPVALAVFAALGSAGLTPVAAQQAQPQTQSLERVTVTGSNIRRTDQETVSPIEIITREQIERSGQPTVSDVLASIPQSLAVAQRELREQLCAGCPRHLAARPGTEDHAGADERPPHLRLRLCAEPSGHLCRPELDPDGSAIERIEILKDGASAIYGSDAIAGVVNVILRKDYQGIEATANVGFFEGANDYRASIVAGFGELGKDKFNVFG